ncbi:hypothetical protein TWF730_007770 [Orbilia blumenaviensis]|uniref:Uncharacterized protein n=1 Tax=Orbilia blumenaviensis TaxID=1796055 RepID=A0AAV9VA20_9PEZI
MHNHGHYQFPIAPNGPTLLPVVGENHRQIVQQGNGEVPNVPAMGYALPPPSLEASHQPSQSQQHILQLTQQRLAYDSIEIKLAGTLMIISHNVLELHDCFCKKPVERIGGDLLKFFKNLGEEATQYRMRMLQHPGPVRFRLDDNVKTEMQKLPDIFSTHVRLFRALCLIGMPLYYWNAFCILAAIGFSKTGNYLFTPPPLEEFRATVETFLQKSHPALDNRLIRVDVVHEIVKFAYDMAERAITQTFEGEQSTAEFFSLGKRKRSDFIKKHCHFLLKNHTVDMASNIVAYMVKHGFEPRCDHCHGSLPFASKGPGNTPPCEFIPENPDVSPTPVRDITCETAPTPVQDIRQETAPASAQKKRRKIAPLPAQRVKLTALQRWECHEKFIAGLKISPPRTVQVPFDDSMIPSLMQQSEQSGQWQLELESRQPTAQDLSEHSNPQFEQRVSQAQSEYTHVEPRPEQQVAQLPPQDFTPHSDAMTLLPQDTILNPVIAPAPPQEYAPSFEPQGVFSIFDQGDPDDLTFQSSFMDLDQPDDSADEINRWFDFETFFDEASNPHDPALDPQFEALNATMPMGMWSF